MGLFKFIATILIIYLLLLAGRYLLRRWLLHKQRQFTERLGQQFGQQGGYAQQNNGPKSQPRKKEGEVRVESTQTAQKKVSRSVGEYVEYEEVEIEYEETK